MSCLSPVLRCDSSAITMKYSPKEEKGEATAVLVDVGDEEL